MAGLNNFMLQSGTGAERLHEKPLAMTVIINDYNVRSTRITDDYQADGHHSITMSDKGVNGIVELGFPTGNKH
jgi:hypothetical protein